MLKVEIQITTTTIDEMEDIPSILYKYREWADKYHQKVITECEVYLAAPTSFEDPKDCKLFKRYDLLKNQDIYNHYYADSIKNNKNWTRQQHRKFARDWTKKSPMKNKSYIKKLQENHFLEFDKRFGVLSLTANPKNIEMWKKYANSHNGFCVGFDSKILFNYVGSGGKVIYYDQLPDILSTDSREVEYIKQTYSKEEKWSFEEEYRTQKFFQYPATEKDRCIKLPKECIKEIIFGHSLSVEDREKITSIFKENNMSIEYFEEIINSDSTISIIKYTK